MAQAIAETVFDVLYLGFAITAGLTKFIKGKDSLITSITMLMIPKTMAYVWIVLMGWKLAMSSQPGLPLKLSAVEYDD